MGIIAFIRAIAFIISIVGKIIALPFALLRFMLKMCWRGLRSLRRILKENKLKRHKRKLARKELRQQKREERKRRKKEKIEKRIKRRKERRQPKRVTGPHELFKGKNNFSVRVLRKIYWKWYSLLKRIYWVTRGILQKIYWKSYSISRRMYWKGHSIFQKIYWKSRTISQKIYWKTYSLYQKIYWTLRGICQKIYWSYYTKSREVYKNITRNAYIELFFVFLRGYLKRDSIRMTFFPICCVKEYVKQHEKTADYRVVEAGKYRTVCIPEFFEKNKERLEQCFSPDIYIAKIHEVELIGGSNVIIAGQMLLNDTVAYDSDKRMDIRYSAIKKVINNVAIIEYSGETRDIEKGINLVGAASFNYYHLVVEILSRLTFIDLYEEYRDFPILVDEIVMKIPQFKAALECINRYKHPVLAVEKEKKYMVGELILPSSNVWMPTNLYDRNTIRVEDFLIADTVLNNIRRAVGVWTEKTPWRKIFISRKNTQAVRLKNEEQVRGTFEQNGFEIVYTEEMTFREQVECFGQAKCVIATSGAALTNTIFCQQGALIGCIIPSYHRFYMYSTIAHLLGLKPIFLDAEIIELTPYAAADTFVLDMEYVKRYINYIEKFE